MTTIKEIAESIVRTREQDAQERRDEVQMHNHVCAELVEFLEFALPEGTDRYAEWDIPFPLPGFSFTIPVTIDLSSNYPFRPIVFNAVWNGAQWLPQGKHPYTTGIGAFQTLREALDWACSIKKEEAPL